MCADDVPAFLMGTCLLTCDNLFKAEAKANGCPDTDAPPSSAIYSLDLEIAN